MEKIYIPALKKHLKRGNFDKAKAIKLLEYYHKNYVRPYMKNPRNYGADYQLNPAERKYLAEMFYDEVMPKIELGNYD